MDSSLLQDRRFYELLNRFDEDEAASCRAQGCRRCGGVLHSARYRRKPRGVPAGGSSAAEGWRASFCCAREACRKRTTPASLRFLGRKVYLATIVVLISAMRCGVTPVRMRRLQELVGVSRQTVARWRTWWCCAFAAGSFWRAGAGWFMPPIATADLPAALLERFAGSSEQSLLSLLRWLRPITTATATVHAS